MLKSFIGAAYFYNLQKYRYENEDILYRDMITLIKLFIVKTTYGRYSFKSIYILEMAKHSCISYKVHVYESFHSKDQNWGKKESLRVIIMVVGYCKDPVHFCFSALLFLQQYK